MAKSPVVILYDAVGVAMSVQDGVAIPVGTSALLVAGKDGGGASRFARVATDGTLRIDPTGTTAQPVTDNGGSLTVDGTVTANAGTGPWPVTDNGGSLTVDASSWPLPTGAATEATLLTRATETTLQSRAAATQLPAALVGARLDTNLGAWLGSVAPTVGQKSMANSVPVVFASDQTPLPVTFTEAGARTGISGGLIVLGGGTANTKVVMRATAYTEQASATQRSIVSASALDTAAGTGARTVRLTYFDNTGAGPLTEVLTLNGVTPVDTGSTTIRFIEKLEVVTVGSLGANAGIITLRAAAGGGGAVVGTLGVGNILTAVGDNTTLWGHHYVASAYTVQLAVLNGSAQSGGSGTNARFYTTYSEPLVANSAEVLIGDVVLMQGSFLRAFDFHPAKPGFGRITAYGIPGVNNATLHMAFDWSENLT